MSENLFRNLPAVNDVLQLPALQALSIVHAHDLIVAAVRRELGELRARVSQGEALDGLVNSDAVAQRVAERLAHELQPRLRSVINATGVVLHTNLGRAPLADEAALAAANAGSGYLNLELDLESGKRSSRQDAVREWICRLTGAESATVVNNNAAATVIVLRALCQGKEVIVSRGQLVEIGGSFRIPEIMAVSGAVLREVGTTNITRLADYERAIGPATAALMQVHTSNYRISGFTESVPLADLVALGKKHGLPVLDDVGSGALLDFARFGFAGEPVVRESIAVGADLVLFSGDKLLGGPQAGIIAGRQDHVRKIERDPLMRAFRTDKMTLAALEATLRIHLNPDEAMRRVPLLRMLDTPLSELRERADKLAESLRQIEQLASVSVREDEAYVGGGSLPDQAMKTIVVEIAARDVSDDQLAQRLRTSTPAVLGRVQGGRLLLDLRTVFPRQDATLVECMQRACQTV